MTSYQAKKVIIHLEVSLHGYQADIQGTQLKKRNFTGQKKKSGYLAMLQTHTDQKCEEKSYFQEYFRVKSSVGTNGWGMGESILSLIRRGHDISVNWDRQIVRFDILSSKACNSENGKDTQLQVYSVHVELKEFSSLIFCVKITAQSISSILAYLRLSLKDM